MAPLVYERLQGECENHVKDVLASILSKTDDSSTFLTVLNT